MPPMSSSDGAEKERDETLLGLPLETALIMGGLIGFWIVYTVVFVWRTRSWRVEDDDRGQERDAA